MILIVVFLNLLRYMPEQSQPISSPLTHKEFMSTILVHATVKLKAFPLQAWTDPWGSRRLRLQNF
jgi:hypothetical protein